jgi:hypothetical protein
MNNKTTILGIIGAIWLTIQPLISTGTFDFSKDWKNIIGAVIVALLGYFAKDYNVTGGTTINTSNDASVVKKSASTDIPPTK